MKWNAILLAGSRPGGDPLAKLYGVELKALIPVAGEPMVRHSARALLNCADIESVTILAQQSDQIAEAVPPDPRLRVLESQATIAETMLELCDNPETRWPLLVTTADHALLSPEMIHDVCWRAARSDIGIGVVTRRRLLASFPESRRTWLRFKKGAYTGANLFVLRSAKVRPAIELWRAVEQDRKKAGKLIWSLGPALFLKVFLRRLTIDEVLHKISIRIGVSIRAVRLSQAIAAIDVDKPSDHDQVEAILAART